jgi:hypothetical protein
MAEKVTDDMGCEDACAAACRKPWATPRVLLSQESRSAGKTTPNFGDTHNTSPPSNIAGS